MFLLWFYSAWHGFLIFILVGWFGTWVLYGNVIPKSFKDPLIMQNIREMIGPEDTCYRVFFKYYMYLCWWLGTPVLLGYAIIYSLVNFVDDAGPAAYKLADGSPATTIQVLANMMNWAPPLFIILYAIYEIVCNGFWASLRPTEEWGPQKKEVGNGGKVNDGFGLDTL